MSETRLVIIHCDGCNNTMSDAQEQGWEEWIRVETFGTGASKDYCGPRCLLRDAGALMADGTPP